MTIAPSAPDRRWIANDTEKMAKTKIEEFLKSHFSAVDRQEPYGEELLRDFLQLGPLHYFIPTSLGGRLERVESYLEVVETTSYYSVPLGLTLGISGTLFLQPMVKFSRPEVRDPVVRDFLESPALGGIMITEPTGGTDIFGLNTTYTQDGEKLRLQGAKCWGGLTGRAGHWLVAARLKRGDRITKRLNLLYVPLVSEGVEVRTYFDALGLQPITYGQTHYEGVELPAAHIVAPEGQSGLRAIYDTLFRTRLGMPAIAAGLCKRLVHEVEERAEGRWAFGQKISQYDQVQFRISGLRGLAVLNHRLWRFTGGWMNDHADVSGDYTLVNAAKILSSETMQTAADSALQIFASAGYKRNHLVGRAYVDTRPFQIFEGSNDVLDENSYEAIVDRHGRCDGAALEEEFQRYGLSLAGDLPAGALELFEGKEELSQRQKVQLGRMISWIFALSLLQGTDGNGEMEARRVAMQRIAELAAAVPYLS